MPDTLLITGSKGYIGQRLVDHLREQTDWNVLGLDIHPEEIYDHGYIQMDIRSPELAKVIDCNNVTHVVHLASVMQPGKDEARDYDIDVNGTSNLLKACVQHGVKHITVTSSGAAYGYHADNPEWIAEDAPLRGNDYFSYSKHKRLIEEMLQELRQTHPELKQLILRPGTVLGSATNNMITDLFRKKRLLAIAGSDSPFVFIWDEDVVQIVIEGVVKGKTGIYNLAGDGAMTIQEIARALGKQTLTLPAFVLQAALSLGKALKLTNYGPEQLDFLRFRPVLSNKRLKEEFGYTPQKTSREVFDYYLQNNIHL